MTIPTKADLANEKSANAAAAAAAAVPGEVTNFTDQIVNAMRAGQTYISCQVTMPSAAAEAQLKANFAAQGWTLNFRRARTGGSISWS